MIIQKLKVFLLSLFIFLIALFLLVRFYDSYLSRSQANYNQKVLTHLSPGSDHLKSLARSKGWVFKITRYFEDQQIYEQTYKLNDFYVRETELKYTNQAREHVIFAGCSFTFGEGIETGDIFTSLLEEEIPEINVYNIAFMGGGIQQTLEWMNLVDVKKMVKEQNGKFVYVFMEYQINRWFGREDYLSWASADFPHYEIENGIAVSRGALHEQDFYKNWRLKSKLGVSKVYEKSNPIAKAEPNDEEMLNIVLAIKSIKKKYLEKFPEGEFYLMIHPMAQISYKFVENMLGTLKIHDIKFINSRYDYMNYSDIHPNVEHDFYIPHDGHPSKMGNRYVADWLKNNFFVY